MYDSTCQGLINVVINIVMKDANKNAIHVFCRQLWADTCKQCQQPAEWIFCSVFFFSFFFDMSLLVHLQYCVNLRFYERISKGRTIFYFLLALVIAQWLYWDTVLKGFSRFQSNRSNHLALILSVSSAERLSYRYTNRPRGCQELEGRTSTIVLTHILNKYSRLPHSFRLLNSLTLY